VDDDVLVAPSVQGLAHGRQLDELRSGPDNAEDLHVAYRTAADHDDRETVRRADSGSSPAFSTLGGGDAVAP
jgi:hypothetical protein